MSRVSRRSRKFRTARFGSEDSRAEHMLRKIERLAYHGETKRAKAWRRAFAQATREDLWWGLGPSGLAH